MPAEHKLVSIGFLTYNGASHIRRSLDALLSQTYPNFELIISDDASTDDTQKICSEYAALDKRVRYIRQPRNLGRRENFRFVVEAARGEYVMWAADDDWWDPHFIEKLAAALDCNQDYALAMSSLHRIYQPEGTVVEKLILTGADNTNRQSYSAIYRRVVNDELIHLFLNGLWRRSFFLKLLSRPMPDTVKWDRIVSAEAALGTHFYSVEPVLFLKTKRKVSIKVRHQEDPERGLHKHHFRYAKYVFIMLPHLLTSPVIPLKNKPLAFWLWLKFFWSQRARIFWVIIGDIRKILRHKLKKSA